MKEFIQDFDLCYELKLPTKTIRFSDHNENNWDENSSDSKAIKNKSKS